MSVSSDITLIQTASSFPASVKYQCMFCLSYCTHINIRISKHTVRLKKTGPWKNVKESVLISVHQFLSLDNKVTV